MSVLNITNTNFNSEVLASEQPVLIDFWASWCGPCRMLSPVIDKIADEVSDVKFGKVNVDEQMKIAKEYRVMSIPTLILFKDGKIAKQELGAKTKEELLEMIHG